MSEPASASAGLSAAGIAAHAAHAAGVAIEVVPETGSTNADLMARAAAGNLAGPVLLLALQQTAGRGRAGRSWLSSAGHSLTFSLAWRFDGPPQHPTGLPLAVGVAVADALAQLAVPVQLKWPNDVYKDGAKLAGILIESQAAADKSTWAVIGIGLDAASVPWLARMDRNALMAALLDSLALSLRRFESTGFAAFAARWNVLHAWAGREVRILDQGQLQQQGVAAGVDDTGRLLLDTAQGRIAISAGDVSLRLNGDA